MPMRTFLAATALIGLGALHACGAEAEGPSGQTTPPAAKADCPDCDPAGPGAFEQTGVGDRFYEAGDTWQVAFRYVHQPLAEKHPDVFLGEDVVESEVFLFDYRVLEVGEATFGDVVREVATIEISQATPSGAHGALFSPERVDEVEHKSVFTLNDLLDPISETVFSRDYPNGKSLALDARSSLRMGASVFPRTIPRLLIAGAIDSPPPVLPVDLVDVVDAMDPAWSSRSYLKYTFDNGDVVYWTKGAGHLWPFYVRNAHGDGVLVGWN